MGNFISLTGEKMDMAASTAAATQQQQQPEECEVLCV